jgi:hypothetical protein
MIIILPVIYAQRLADAPPPKRSHET